MLNGVGGRTIAEAKERISYDEYQDWVEYAKRRGGFNLGMRIEACSAMIAVQVNNGNGGKAKMADFMPHKDEPVASLEDMFSMIKVSSKSRKSKPGKG